MQGLEPIGPVLNLCRLDDSCQLLLSLVQAYRLLQVMVQTLASMPHHMRLYEKISRGTGRQGLSSTGIQWHSSRERVRNLCSKFGVLERIIAKVS